MVLHQVNTPEANSRGIFNIYIIFDANLEGFCNKKRGELKNQPPSFLIGVCAKKKFI